MPSLRSILTASATAATALAAAAAAAPAAGEFTPVVKVEARVPPAHLPITKGTPLTIHLDTTFASNPPGANFVLQHADYLFGAGATLNGRLFPSCSVATLQAAHGVLSKCPRARRSAAAAQPAPPSPSASPRPKP